MLDKKELSILSNAIGLLEQARREINRIVEYPRVKLSQAELDIVKVYNALTEIERRESNAM